MQRSAMPENLIQKPLVPVVRHSHPRWIAARADRHVRSLLYAPESTPSAAKQKTREARAYVRAAHPPKTFVNGKPCQW
jgi:hypothetical protein